MNNELRIKNDGSRSHNSKFMLHTSNQSGFTLIEILLYISIVSLLLFAVGISSQAFLEARTKNQVIADVNNEGTRAMNFILQTIRNADAITSPSSSGSTANQLDLDVPGTALTTSFKLAAGKIQITEDSGSTWVDLTNSDKVLVSAISPDTEIFKNLSRTLTPGIIRARFNVAHVEPSEASRYFQRYDRDFQGASSLR